MLVGMILGPSDLLKFESLSEKFKGLNKNINLKNKFE